jgi:hypothetical protein
MCDRIHGPGMFLTSIKGGNIKKIVPNFVQHVEILVPHSDKGVGM